MSIVGGLDQGVETPAKVVLILVVTSVDVTVHRVESAKDVDGRLYLLSVFGRWVLQLSKSALPLNVGSECFKKSLS